MSALSKLFQPVKVGNLNLRHRVVMAPMTRFRANKNHAHTDLGVEYYKQRASAPGTLLITEGTFLDGRSGGYDNVPALETDEQLKAWKRVTDAVHEKGSYIYTQLWALGRTADPTILARDGFPFVSASDIPLQGRPKPRPLTVAEIKEYVQLYAQAAHNAVTRAGFDGVEIHGANGYLVDQFIQDVTNNRTDEYGGSIENRSRFALEIIKAVSEAIGENKTSIRFSPWSAYHEMRMKDPKPTFSYLVSQIATRHPSLAYIHVVEDEVDRNANDFLREIWQRRPFISANGYTRDTAIEVVEKKGDIVAFARAFLANPDLPARLKHNVPLNEFDFNTFYTPESPKGFIDYPFKEGLKF
ncbi:putative NADPH2 dehydrogenase chain OYE2 [Panus rudis PR-1116 ss-1]|nr:putative NADPH2 dehydrogenase chain OYE2 [Panus rudis PR-1116 ss-1]